MTCSEKINLTISIISIVIAIFSIFISKSSAERIAQKSGSYDKSKLSVYLGDAQLLGNTPMHIYMGVNSDSSILNFTDIPLIIRSAGEKTVDGISIIYTYPHLANMVVDNDIVEVKSIMKDIERVINKDEPFDQVSLNIPSLKPGMTLKISDIFNVPSQTSFNEEINALDLLTLPRE